MRIVFAIFLIGIMAVGATIVHRAGGHYYWGKIELSLLQPFADAGNTDQLASEQLPESEPAQVSRPEPAPELEPATGRNVALVSLAEAPVSKPELVASPGSSSFEQRCFAPQVILCDPLDTEGPYGIGITEDTPHADGLPFDGRYRDWRWIQKTSQWGTITPAVMDNEIKASGTGSLKFIIPSESGAGRSGYYQTNFTPDNSVQFGEGETFFVQWRQRFSRNMLFDEFDNRRKYRVTGGAGGFKTIIINAGDHSSLEYPTNSCTNQHIVFVNSKQFGAIAGYHSCGRYAGFVRGYGLHKKSGRGQFDRQPGGDSRCWRLDPDTGAALSQAFRDCVMFWPDEWMTFQVQVSVGKWAKKVNDPERSSNIKLWVAREGEPSKLVIDHNLNLIQPEKSVMKYGKIWLLPYHTNKDHKEVHPEAYTWYDELIVSRAPIPDP